MKNITAPPKAFTLIELLVVIAIIAVLMGILMPALSRVKEQARQKSCGTRVRQQTLGLIMYADDFNGKMPEAKGGSWFQDVGHSLANYLLATGMTPEMFYCPSNQTQNIKEYWDLLWTHSPSDPESFDGKRFVRSGYSVAGYGFILDIDINQYPTDAIKPEGIKSNRMKMPSARPMVVDLIMSQDSEDAKLGVEFGRITKGGLWINHDIWDTTSHLVNDELPAGGNIGFLDGHIEWKKWNYPEYPPDDGDGKPLPRAEGSSSSPDFYW